GPLALALLYVVTVDRRRARGRGWPVMRTALFALGSALLSASMLLPSWAGDSFSVHVAQHLLLGMLAPIAIALAAPMSLLLVSLRPAPRRRVVRVLHHPALAVLVVGGMAALYLTPLYAWSEANPTLHLTVHAHFCASGYVFAWAIAGADPAPGQSSVVARLA